MAQEIKQIFGNSVAQDEILSLLNHSQRMRTVALVGPSHVGRQSYIKQVISSITSESDIIIPDPSIDGVREVINFMTSQPLRGKFKAVIIDGADKMPYASQNSLLKILEEPSENCVVFLIVEEVESLLPPIKDRIELTVRWKRLTDHEMGEFVRSNFEYNEDVLKLCDGIPGFYELFLNNDGYMKLKQICISLLSGKTDAILCEVPKVIAELKHGSSIERDAIISIVNETIKTNGFLFGNSSRAEHLGCFASVIYRNTSVNAEIHWKRACVQISCLASE
jgi:hypothetical protein